MKRVSLLYLVLYFHKTHRDEIFLKSHLSVNVPENKKLQELPQKTHRWACRQLCEPNLWTKAPLKWIPNPWTLCARATVAQARGEGRGGLPWHALTPSPPQNAAAHFLGCGKVPLASPRRPVTYRKAKIMDLQPIFPALHCPLCSFNGLTWPLPHPPQGVPLQSATSNSQISDNSFWQRFLPLKKFLI